jgi:hypothetical protein
VSLADAASAIVPTYARAKVAFERARAAGLCRQMVSAISISALASR